VVRDTAKDTMIPIVFRSSVSFVFSLTSMTYPLQDSQSSGLSTLHAIVPSSIFFSCSLSLS
jgi:hypothetical protein